MNNLPKFFLGLLCGLVISFFVFNGNSVLNANSAKGTITHSPIETADETIDGKWINMSDAQPLIDAYKTDFIDANKLSGNTSTGGFIKRSVLNDITGPFDGAYIKYSFYYQGNGQIGIIFQKQSENTQVIRTGSAAFCPNMCQFPD
jgi:hypothetical protein